MKNKIYRVLENDEVIAVFNVILIWYTLYIDDNQVYIGDNQAY